jgi:hypothetical protein
VGTSAGFTTVWSEAEEDGADAESVGAAEPDGDVESVGDAEADGVAGSLVVAAGVGVGVGVSAKAVSAPVRLNAIASATPRSLPRTFTLVSPCEFFMNAVLAERPVIDCSSVF